jgi:N6-adenosine-specific RNA methylase IME4
MREHHRHNITPVGAGVKVILSVNPSLKALIPQLTPDEYEGLERSIVAEGCRFPLLVWGDLLVDGHNRYEICTRHNIPFQVQQIEFESEAHARIWMRNHALGQRNLTDAWKIELALGNKADLLEVGREAMSAAAPLAHIENQGLTNLVKPLPRHNTQAEIAKEASVSQGTISRAEQVRKKAPELWEKAKAGDLTVGAAYAEVVKKEKKERREAEIEQQRKAIAELPAEAIPDSFDVVVIDPPWPYGRKYDPEGSRVANPYPEMQLEDIAAINIPAKDNAVMFLWTTHQFLPASFALLREWGFEYKATLVWDKEKIGMGAWLRMQCEFCLVGIRGKPIWDNTTHRDVLREPRREHSRKPDGFYALVEQITVGTRIDYFSRQQRQGWYSYGNDVGKF